MNILITGARSGIGNKLALYLSKKHNVYAGCHTEKEVETAEKNKYFKYIKFDITDENDYKKINEYEIDCLINQAGICYGGSLIDLDINKIKKNFNVNVFSTLNLTKYFIKYKFENNEKGIVLITSSLIDILPVPYLGCYMATKATLTALSKVLNNELKLSKSQVKIRLIKPGAYKTGFNDLMINDIYKSKYFKNNEKNKKILKIIFKILESKNIYSIIKQMEKSITYKSNRFIYSAPKIQKLFYNFYKRASL